MLNHQSLILRAKYAVRTFEYFPNDILKFNHSHSFLNRCADVLLHVQIITRCSSLIRLTQNTVRQFLLFCLFAIVITSIQYCQNFVQIFRATIGVAIGARSLRASEHVRLNVGLDQSRFEAKIALIDGFSQMKQSVIDGFIDDENRLFSMIRSYFDFRVANLALQYSILAVLIRQLKAMETWNIPAVYDTRGRQGRSRWSKN